MIGYGTYYINQKGHVGDKIEGYFKNGLLTGTITYYFNADPKFTGDKWVGPISQDGQLTGKGTYYRSNGESFSATYLNGEPQGGLLDFLMTPPDKVPSTQGSFGK